MTTPPMAIDPESPSEELVARAQSGDEKAFEQLFTNHLPSLQAFVRFRMGALLRSREGVSDIVQSACREVIQDLGNFVPRGRGSFRAWLLRMVERKISNHRRHHLALKRDARADVALPATHTSDGGGFLESVAASILAPGRSSVEPDDAEWLTQQLDSLEETERTAILLRVVCDLPWEEVVEFARDRDPAATLDGLRQRYYRAMASLRERWRARNGGPS